MKDITVTIDRISGSNSVAAKKAMEEIVAALKPFRDRGLRIRIGRSTTTLKEDRAWRKS